MTYKKTDWINNVTVVDALNLNNMENAISEVVDTTEAHSILLNKKFDSVTKSGNKLVFSSKGVKKAEVDLSSIAQSGPQGIQGPQGPKGENGKTPDIQIGNVTTLNSTQLAYVTRRGTDENPIFDFGIPKGETGVDTELQESVTTNTNDIATLTTNMNNITTNVNNITTNVNNININMNTLTASVNELVSDIDNIKQALNSDIAKIKDNVNNMKTIL